MRAHHVRYRKLRATSALDIDSGHRFSAHTACTSPSVDNQKMGPNFSSACRPTSIIRFHPSHRNDAPEKPKYVAYLNNSASLPLRLPGYSRAMPRRKPAIAERRKLAVAAVEYIEHHTVTQPDISAYDLAFRGLGKIDWLHAQSRDGIAAYAASCWHTGVAPYSDWTDTDLHDAELHRQEKSRHNRVVALESNARLRAERDALG